MFTELAVEIGWDGSGPAWRAAEWVAARFPQKAIELVHIVPGEETGSDYLSATATTSVERVSTMDDADRLREAHPGLHVNTRTVRGDVLEQLAQLSHDGLLVLGSARERRKSASRWSTGSRLAGTGTTGAVLVIPDDVGDRHRAGVLVGVDGTASSHATAMVAAEVADALGEPLTVVHAWTEPIWWHSVGGGPEDDPGLEQMHRQVLEDAALEVTAPGRSVQTLLASGEPSLVLGDLSTAATLLVVGSHGRRRIAGGFSLGSVCHALLLDLRAPTLVVRP